MSHYPRTRAVGLRRSWINRGVASGLVRFSTDVRAQMGGRRRLGVEFANLAGTPQGFLNVALTVGTPRKIFSREGVQAYLVYSLIKHLLQL